MIEKIDNLIQDSLAERSKAEAQGAIPKGRRFEPHSCQCFSIEEPGLNRAAILALIYLLLGGP